MNEKPDDSDLEGDLADPYGPYSLFAKYLKPEKKSRKKFSKNEKSIGASSLKNRDWQTRLRSPENQDDIESRFATKYGLSKTLFSPEKSPSLQSERCDFSSCEKESHFHRKVANSRYDSRALEKDEKSYAKIGEETFNRKRPLSERYDRNEEDITKPPLERYDIRGSEREEKKMGGYQDTYDTRREVLSYEEDVISKAKKDRNDLERPRPLSERYGFGYRAEDLTRDREYLDELPRPVSGKRKSRFSGTDQKSTGNKNEDFRGGREDHDRYEPERYDSRSKEGKKTFQKVFRDREISREKKANKDLKKGRMDYECVRNPNDVKSKKSPEFNEDFEGDERLKSGKPFYERKVGNYDNLSDDESFAELLDKFHIGPYLQKAISLTKKSLSPKSSTDLPTSSIATKYGPSELQGKHHSGTKSSEIDLEKRRLPRLLSPGDLDEESTWKSVPEASMLSPDNAMKTRPSDNVSFGLDPCTKWTTSPEDRKSDETSPKAYESRKNIKVGSLISLEKDLNDGSFESTERKAEIGNGGAAFSIDNLGLDSEKKRVGYETSIEKGFASIGWSGRYDTAQEYFGLDGISQTADSEGKVLHYLNILFGDPPVQTTSFFHRLLICSR